MSTSGAPTGQAFLKDLSLSGVNRNTATAPDRLVSFSFSISLHNVVRVLTGCAVVLAALSVSGHLIQMYLSLPLNTEVARVFSLGGEKNVASWFSSFLLLTAAALLAYIANRLPGERRSHWGWLSAIFVFLSIDETAVLHERLLDLPMREWLHPTGFLDFPWVIVGWSFVAVLTLCYWRFVWGQRPRIRALFLSAAIVYLSGALVLEMVSAWYHAHAIDELIIRGALSTVQELAEIAGVIIFIYALLLHISDHPEISGLQKDS